MADRWKNRMRLTLQVIDAVRKEVGPDFILSIRMTGDELTKEGLSVQDCISAARLIEATGQVDLLNILAGAPYDDLGLAEWVRPMGLPSAPHLTVAGHLREAVDIPILHAGGIADIATARHAIVEGHIDLVGMTRAQMADPYLVAKLARGEEERIRPCVGPRVLCRQGQSGQTCRLRTQSRHRPGASPFSRCAAQRCSGKSRHCRRWTRRA